MADRMGVEVDASGLLRSLDRYPVLAQEYASKRAAGETAQAIAREARGRARRSSPPSPIRDRSGRLRDLIRVEEDARGFSVTAHDPSTRLVVDVYNEFGTKYMTARPFLFSSAELEAGRHIDRVWAALNQAANEVGLGD